MLIDLVGAILTAVSLLLGVCLIRIGFVVLRGNRNEYNRNRNRLEKSLLRVISGNIPTKYDGTRDDKVAAGVAIDLKKNEWKEQGRLSDEALRDALAH
ncbi:MAG: hypothetical protein K9G30_05975 [Parvibaculum sp.]|nr:hypothetical protein [Parvibaculum sp.]